MTSDLPATDTHICFLSLADLGARYRDGSLSAVAVAERHLQRIVSLEPHLNAFQIVDRDGALAAAREADARLRAGKPRGALDGAPVTIKDNVDVAGFPTRHGSTTRAQGARAPLRTLPDAGNSHTLCELRHTTCRAAAIDP